MKTKIKKFVSIVLLGVYGIGIYWFLSLNTAYPLLHILTLLASILFMIVTHELGHLIFGLLTGYRFVSFRVFSFMLVRSEGKWAIRKMSVPGTGGQCLMDPPEKKNGKFPFVLYNLGGILFCGALSLIPMIIGLSGQGSEFRMMFFSFGFCSFAMNLLNAIPTNGKSMLNDATNLKMALKSDVAQLALWNQLKYAALNAGNISSADMPEELFFMPDKKELSNPLIFWQILAVIDRAEAMGEYEKAKESAYFALDNVTAAPFYQRVLQIEAVYLGSILDSDPERTAEYYEKMQKIPALKSFASFHRASYAYLLLVKQDPQGAETVLSEYRKRIERAPYRVESDFEQKQLDHIRSISNT